VLTGNTFGVFIYPALAAVVVVTFVRDDHHRPRVVCMGIFAIYVVEALKEMLFPIPVDGSIARSFASVPFWTHANLVPIRDLLSGAAERGEVIRNILVAVPFGFGAWFVARRPSVAKVAIAGVVASLLVETLQVIIGATIGFMYRVADVNDVILNTLGTLLGIILFMAFAMVFESIDGRIEEPRGRYWSFVRAVTARPIPLRERSGPAPGITRQNSASPFRAPPPTTGQAPTSLATVPAWPDTIRGKHLAHCW